MSLVFALVTLVVLAKSFVNYFPALSFYIWVADIFSTVMFRYRKYLDSQLRLKGAQSVSVSPGLFPFIDDNQSIEKLPVCRGIPLDVSSTSKYGPQPCSTGVTTRLLPFKNEKGEIDWAFSDIVPGHELDAFRVTAVSTDTKSSGQTSATQLPPVKVVNLASSNSDSLPGKKLDSVLQIDTPSSSSSEDNNQDIDDEGSAEACDGDENYQCPHCMANFKMRGYLTRHMKKHSTQKAYKCPFHSSSDAKGGADGSFKCHPTGGFSRRDTYKTHLKTRHFRYPRGTSIKERNSLPGSCSMCGEWFENAEVWTEIHIEGAECKFLPTGFKGKSRIKIRLKKQMARMIKEQKLEMMKNSVSHLYLRPECSQTFSTPNSTIKTLFPCSDKYRYTPDPSSRSFSAVFSTVSHTGTPHTDQLLCPKPISSHHTFDMGNPPSYNCSQGLLYADACPDYGDEYCLDTDQMSFTSPAYAAIVRPEAHLTNVEFLPEVAHVISQYSH